MQGSIVSSDLAVNPDFGRDNAQTLLTGTDVLPAGAIASVEVIVEFTPGSAPGPFFNTAIASSAEGASDESTSGTDPDPNGDGNPKENEPTRINVASNPAISLDKAITDIRFVDPGYEIDFLLNVANAGDVPLSSVQIVDHLRDTFPEPIGVRVPAPPAVEGALMLGNDAFSPTDSNLLRGTETLAVGAEAHIRFTVELTLGEIEGPFTNQATARGTAPNGTVVSDSSSAELDPVAEQPPPTPLPGGVRGTVFLDRNHDRTLDEADPRLADWRVELLDADTELLEEVIVGADGSYLITDLPPGNYAVQFRHPETQVTWGRIPVTIIAEQIVVVDLPVDPQGVVYDARTRQIVPGVRVGLADAEGMLLPDACLLPDQQSQPVGSDAAYRFVILHGAASACPANPSDYQLTIEEAPAGYTDDFSTQIIAEDASFDLIGCAAPCLIQAQDAPPPEDADTTYFTTYSASSSTQVMINNHLPIDRRAETGPRAEGEMAIDVRPTRRTVRAGGVLGYIITLTNLSETVITDLEVTDQTAPGIQAMDDTAVLVRPGADGLLGTSDDERTPLAASGAGPIDFAPFTLDPGAQAQIEFAARVSAGARLGPQRNTSFGSAVIVGNPVTVDDSAVVNVIADPMTSKATVIGKVFVDHNEDGIQQTTDEHGEERGLPGVRLLTPEGLLIETDANGRFHIADIDVTRQAGINYVVKIDTFSLPAPAEVMSDVRQVVRLLPGDIGKINFAVRHKVTDKDCCGEYDKLYSYDPFRAEKKLDVNFIRVAQAPAKDSKQWQLDFKVDRNYRLQARYAQLLVRKADTRHYDDADAACFELRADQQIQSVTVDADPDEKLAFVLRVFDASSCLEGEAPPADADFDQTSEQLLDLRKLSEDRTTRAPPIGRSLLEIDDLTLNNGYRDRRVHRHNAVTKAQDTIINQPAQITLDPFPWYVDPVDEAPEVMLPFGPGLEVNFEPLGVEQAEPPPPLANPLTRQPIIVEDRGATELAYRDEQGHQHRHTLIFASSLSELKDTYDFDFEVTETDAGEAHVYQIALFHNRFSLWEPLETVCLRADATESVGISIPRIDLEALRREDEELTLLVDVHVYTGPDCGLLPGTRVTRDFKEPRQTNFRADNTTTHMTCCGIPIALRTFVDEHNDVTTVRIDNLAAPESNNALSIVKEVVDGTQQDQNWGPLPPNTSREYYLGEFDVRGTKSVDDWSRLRIILDNGLTDGEMYFELNRERSEGNEYWRAPRITAHCFGVTATPLIEDDGVASIAHQSVETPLVRKPPKLVDSINYGVAVVDLTLGGYSSSGGLDALLAQNGLDDSDYAAGRVAGYWRGRVPHHDQTLEWVVQLDTTKDDLSNLGDNLRREDPQRLFRQLDSDLFYSTYGDDSTTILDTNSQGAFYGRVDYGDSHALWGNYNTGLTATEFAHYNRTLYGLQVDYRDGQIARPGERAYQLSLFASEAQSALAHAEFNATGGSLYYLKHTDIVMGSEKVWVEVRRRDSEQIEEREILIAGRDYEIDPIQGRILLQRPLSQVLRDRYASIINSTPLDGDEVYLIVDYEYVPASFAAEDYVYGARGKLWLTDDLQLGVTHVTEENGAGDYTLSGVDAVWHYGRNSYLSAEYADADDARLGADVSSFDGGLSFDLNGALPQNTSGGALGFESYTDLNDLGLGDGTLKGWWKEREAGFSSGRFALGPKVTDLGVDLDIKLSEHIHLSAGAAELEREGIARSQTARAQVSSKLCGNDARCTYADVEMRYENVDLLSPDSAPWHPGAGQARLLGGRIGRDLNATTTLYAAAQTAVDQDDVYANNDRMAVGVNTRLSHDMLMSVEASDGSRGEALIAGVDYTLDEKASFNLSGGVGSGALTQFATRYQLSEGHDLYGSYRVDPDRSDTERNMLTFGQRRDLGRRSRIFTETQFGKAPRQASTTHALGLEYDALQNWVVATTLQHGTVERAGGEFERSAASIGTSFQNEDTRFSARIEYRTDEGLGTDLEQYIFSSALSRKLAGGNSLQAKLNTAWLEDTTSDRDTGRFAELDIGYAHRPALSDRINFISRYAYLWDVGSEGQRDAPGDEKSHLLSTEGIFEVHKRVQVGGKLGYRHGEVRLDKGQGDWIDTRTALAIARSTFRFNLPGKDKTDIFPDPLELVVEYRWLKDLEGKSRQHGALLGIYKQIDGRRLKLEKILEPSIRIGAGYNFSGFDDDMRRDSYEAHGWFIDIMALF